MIVRNYIQELVNRMNEERNFIQVLYGPRQVGKTTMILQLRERLSYETMYAAADDVPAADRTWIKTTWDEARRRLAASPEKRFLLIIDEVQKVDNWSETVKKEWDEDARTNINLKIILMGSSSLLIQQGLTESLAGRFESIYIPHWSYPEMRDAFGWSLEQYIWYGGYPGSAKLIKDEYRWKNYIKNSLVETSISKDILMLTKVEKPALLRRLFEVGSVYSSQIVAMNKVQGDLQEKGNLTTLSNYLKLLENAGLLAGLEKYPGEIVRQRAAKPKFQVFNNALFSSQLSLIFAKAKTDRTLWGRLTESAVGQHLINSSAAKKFNLYYWNASSCEVDFVIEKNDAIIAIEVKSGKDSRSNGMSVFNETFHPKRLFTVGTDGIPLEEFLSSEPEMLFDV
ncbi:MAG: ATP-binding protein [Dysgonamonadaceae bacterium]|jgi:predicted AAA+ superfamily ATPase|nr:ATP-binding protein [Dysgonamonadaceae bacterium]